ncbi:MAG: glycosyl transferase group 1 [Acidimicrobiia bacterium]|nr:glycosyl transferase group 1 [Acidimicrobiia bacterium]
MSDGLAAAAAVVAPTAAMAGELQRWYGLSGALVIPNGRRHDWVNATPKEPLVLSAGRLADAAKNVGAVERAAHRLAWPVVMAGDGPYDPTSPARRLGVLSFPELAQWLQRASIFALPACYEPFGLGPLEAAQAGCALVLGDIASLHEVWGDAADYVDPADDEALVAACQRLIADPAYRAQRADAARQRAGAFTPEAMASAYWALYRRIAARERVR